jgi:hypothetical protein
MFKITNTITQKTVKNAIDGKPFLYPDRETAEDAAKRMTLANRAMAAYRMKSARFNYVVEVA